MVKIKQAGTYIKMLREISLNEEMSFLVEKKVELFKNNSDDTRLENHPLRKTMEGKWAFSITDDIRIVYELVGKNTVRFLAIGGHGDVY